MNGFRKVITKPGEVLAYETVFEENPYLRTGVPEKMGSVERLDYDTAVYGNGVTYHKTAYVYLPYCYDKADKQSQTDVAKHVVVGILQNAPDSWLRVKC